LVNNVGVSHAAPLEETSLEDFDRIMRINTRSAVQCTKAVLAGMREARFGRIVNLASRAIVGMPALTAYGASKAAIAGLTRTWAMELASDAITVNAIAPGPIDTDMFRAVNPPGSTGDQMIRGTIPVGRLGEPADIANAASYFLDARSSFTTGQVLFVCGGMSIGRIG
jgi:NAD(P)-dependent dehydrogenase (short-subunit alcohol dehydrogenase family)